MGIARRETRVAINGPVTGGSSAMDSFFSHASLSWLVAFSAVWISMVVFGAPVAQAARVHPLEVSEILPNEETPFSVAVD